MSGNDRLLVDTNIFIFLLNGNSKAAQFLEGKTLFFSFVTEIELLGFPGITVKEQAVVAETLDDCIKIDLSEAISRTAIAIKQRKKTKIPDALIAATAIEFDLPLLTADVGFEDIQGLTTILFKI